MKNKRRASAGSSFIASWVAIAIILILSAVSLRYSLTALGAVLSFLGVLGLVAKLWGMGAVKGLEAEFNADRNIVEIGQSVNFNYTVENRKPLPVMWLEFCVRAEKDPCLTPAFGFDKGSFEEADVERYGFREFYRRRLVFLMGFQALSWQTAWTARHRGVFIEDGCFLRTGDSFGLAESSAVFENSCAPIAVLPKIEPVILTPFLRQAWLGNTGKRGQVEDITILNSLRDYQNGDSWKRIDWRAAARQDEIKVKIFEKVTPERVHFIFDCASFAAPADVERALSLLASVLVALDEAGIPCGITLPARQDCGQIDMYAENGDSTESMLFELAGFEAIGVHEHFDTDSMLYCDQESVQLWVISSGGAGKGCRELITFFENSGIRLLTDVPSRNDDVSALEFDDITEGGV
ncbi:MAG: DUF58 domain-containing protein [Oscillospiraceae bacterium]|nr:DUF58 domain-containing protein [Oscillospiraceae bacterium]